MMNRRTNLFLCCAVLVLGTLARPVPVAAGEARAHDGFFMRLSTGFGAARAKLEDSGSSAELKGAAEDVNLAFGGMVGNNLALHGTLWGWTISDPDAKLVGSGGSTTFSTKGSLTMGALGAGLTYYVMPANVYFSGSVGMGSLLGKDDVDGKSKTGFAMDLTAGKEWWVGDAWGLGAAADFSFFNAKNQDIVPSNESWAGPGFGIRFSATFN